MSISYDLFQVGGHVRDSLIGVQSNDIDYTVVINNPDDFADARDAFDAFEADIIRLGYKVFLSKPEVFTIRSKFPNSNEVADFVLARKEAGYTKGTRLPEVVELGALVDDLKRRDFTVNAMALDINDRLIDPFDGQSDLLAGILRTPVDPDVSFNDDPLRILRGLRFAVTKDFIIDSHVWEAISKFDIERFSTVSKERVAEELKKMFMFSTMESLLIIAKLKAENPALWKLIFNDSGVRLKPTLEP